MGPHDGFGIAGRAAGVQEPEVITGPLDTRCRLVGRKEIVVVHSTVEQFAATDLDHQLEIRQRSRTSATRSASVTSKKSAFASALVSRYASSSAR